MQNNLENLTKLYKLRKKSFGKYYSEIEAEINKIKLTENISSLKHDKSYLNWLVWQTPPVLIQSLFLIFWLLSLYCIYKIYSSHKILSKYIFTFFISFILGLFLFYSNNIRNKKIAILKEQTNLKLGPSKEHIDRAVLPKFKDIEILSSNNNMGGWYKIKADSIIGWLSKDDVELID